MICWLKRCTHPDHDDLVLAGRTKSGRRWLWAVAVPGDGALVDAANGYEDSEAEAVAAYTAAAEQEAAGRLLKAVVQAGVAVGARKRLSDAERAARPAPDAVDAAPVEYLYGTRYIVSDDNRYPDTYTVVQFPIAKKTPKRIYYLRNNGADTGSVDRQTLERDGDVRNRGRSYYDDDWHLYATGAAAQAVIAARTRPAVESVDLKALRRAAVDAHPDRGGTHEGFLEANARYERAKKQAA